MNFLFKYASFTPRWSLKRLCSSISFKDAVTFEASFMTTESDPRKHNESHLGRFYTLPSTVTKSPQEECQKYYPIFTPKALERGETLNEHVILARKPAIEVISYLSKLDVSQTNCAKFVIYGSKGNGKTYTLAHINHYLMLSDFIFLNFASIRRWLVRYKQIEDSVWKVGFVNHVYDARVFLMNFMNQNKNKIEGLHTHKEYKFTNREQMEPNQPLSEIVSYGIDRPKYAPDCINILLKELKLHCQENNPKCKVAISIDGINCLFGEITLVDKEVPIARHKIFTKEKCARLCTPNELSIVYNLKKMLGNDYPNKVIVCSVDSTHTIHSRHLRGSRTKWHLRTEKAMIPKTESIYPFSLLGQEGWEKMDPFVPIEVLPFSDHELNAYIDYYISKKYISDKYNTEEGRQEIKFLTGGNGADFEEYSVLW